MFESWNTSQLGTAGEMFVMSVLVGRGLQVFWNVARQGPADLLAWSPGGVPVLVDVKTNNSSDDKKPFVTEDGVHVVWVQGGRIDTTPEMDQLLGCPQSIAPICSDTV
ncbi:MAG: hypothetical protein VW076_00085 [Synechococcus sp.]